MTAQVQLPISLTDNSTVILNSMSGQQQQSPPTSPTDTAVSSEGTDCSPTILTVRMIMQGKEVGSIIGKKGDNVKRYREESGAKINISDASCPERIVTVTGVIDQIHKAFNLICTKFEDIREMNAQTNPGSVLPPISLRLVIPASQCGSLIGKGGTKIKEIRETSGASVQVASDMLPGSTERAVTISGPSAAIIHCLQEICAIMLESPPKGATIPYRPKPAIQAPLMYAAAAGAAAAYSLPPHMHQMAAVNFSQTGQLLTASPAVTTQATNSAVSSPEQQRHSQPPAMVSTATGVAATAATSPTTPYPHPSQLAQLQASHQGTPLVIPPATSATANSGVAAQLPYGSFMNPALAMAPTGIAGLGAYLGRPNFVAPQQQTTSTEMIIPNELIGCIIGRGGAKINEIRQLSGAQIKISNCEEGNSDRKVTITGFPETITMAAYLINTSIELHKNQLLNTDANSAALNTAVANQNALQASMTAAATMMPAGMAQGTAVSASLTKPLSVYPYNTAQAASIYGLGANPMAGLTAGFAAYDPKAFLNASKLKVLPSTGVIKQDHRFAPY